MLCYYHNFCFGSDSENARGQALRMLERLEDDHCISSHSNNNNNNTNNTNTNTNNIQQALHMFERLEDDHGISICYENLGDTYMQMGEIRQVYYIYIYIYIYI